MTINNTIQFLTGHTITKITSLDYDGYDFIEIETFHKDTDKKHTLYFQCYGPDCDPALIKLDGKELNNE